MSTSDDGPKQVSESQTVQPVVAPAAAPVAAPVSVAPTLPARAPERVILTDDLPQRQPELLTRGLTPADLQQKQQDKKD